MFFGCGCRHPWHFFRWIYMDSIAMLLHGQWSLWCVCVAREQTSIRCPHVPVRHALEWGVWSGVAAGGLLDPFTHCGGGASLTSLSLRLHASLSLPACAFVGVCRRACWVSSCSHHPCMHVHVLGHEDTPIPSHQVCVSHRAGVFVCLSSL